MLLGVVADLEAVAGHDLAGVRGVDAGQDAQHGGLAGAVEAEDHHPAALVDGQVDVGEDLQGPVGLRQLGRGERRAPARGGGGELDAGHLVVGALALEAGHHLLGALEHALRRRGLGGLGAHLVGLVGERLGLVLGVDPLPLAAPLVGLALEQVVLPAHVVDVDLGAVGVQVQHPGHAGLEQRRVVGDHHQPAAEGPQELAQPDDRVGVEVVGGLVQQQRLGAGEQDPRQLHPAALAAREGAQRLGHQPVRDARGRRRSVRPRPPRRTHRRRAARRRPARSGASPGPGPPGPPSPSPSRPSAAGGRRRPARARRGSARARAGRGRRCGGPAAGSPPVRSSRPSRRPAAPRPRGSWSGWSSRHRCARPARPCHLLRRGS